MNARIILSWVTGVLALCAPPAAAESAADLPKLIAEAARYESGQSVEPVQRIEQLLRDSAGQPSLRADLEAAAVKLLGPEAAPEARRFACQVLAVVGSDTSLPALAELLKSDETAGIACLALSGRQSPKINELLRSALPSARGRTRLQILGALGNHRDLEAVPTLVPLTRDPNDELAVTAIQALGKIGGPAARSALDALGKDAAGARRAALTEATLRIAEQLAAAGDKEAAATIYSGLIRPPAPTPVRRGALAALLKLDPDGAQRRILDTLRSGDPALVPVAIAQIAAVPSKDATQTFAALLPGLPYSAQAWMIQSLADRGDAEARAAIRAQVASADAEVRRAAIMAVGRLEDGGAAALLVGALGRAQTPEEIQSVEAALVGLRGGEATDRVLGTELGKAPPQAKVRLSAVLARRGSRAAVPALLAEAGSADAATAKAALQSLGRIAAGDDLPAILEKLVGLKASEARDEAETAAARVMARIADASRRSAMVQGALRTGSGVEARLSLVRLLPHAGDASALAALNAAAQDKEPRVRDVAVRALAVWPDPSGWDALLTVFRQSDSATHRELALRALVRLAGGMNANPDAALVDRYRQLLAGARGNDQRKLILGALAGAARPEALELVLPLLADADVRAEAGLAVEKIAESIRAQHPQAAKAALERLKAAKKDRWGRHPCLPPKPGGQTFLSATETRRADIPVCLRNQEGRHSCLPPRPGRSAGQTFCQAGKNACPTVDSGGQTFLSALPCNPTEGGRQEYLPSCELGRTEIPVRPDWRSEGQNVITRSAP